MNILYAEDDDCCFDLVRLILGFDEHEVKRAKNGEEALELFLTNPYSLILTDLIMPLVDGYGVIKEIRRYDLITPVLAVSAQTFSEVEQRCKDAGFNDYIEKPFHTEEFRGIIAKYVDWRLG